MVNRAYFTSEEIKEKIFNFLKSSHGKKYTGKELAKQLDICSYPTILKWCEVLIALNRIRADHYGNIKLVYVE